MSPITCSDSSGADALYWQGRRALDSRAIGGDENAARTDAAGDEPGQVIGNTPWGAPSLSFRPGLDNCGYAGAGR